MDQDKKQNEPSDNQKEKQQQNKDKQEKRQKQFEQPPKPQMILRMQTGRDGMNFEGMARDEEVNSNYSKVFQNILIKN
ncbi:unnamed protein product [Paramecium sonneborni]|uniref:Uncharacterized protein n=1 Tax=Paramecium sonneborni TaxID=65129 RepID=A0A8S1R2V9_9CILI|nr:unnamed protein product [Paramecium sonneborni]